MTDTLRDLVPEDMSDETAYHIGNFLHDLAFAFEGIYYGNIRRYHTSARDVANEMRRESQKLNGEEDLK